MTFVSEILYQDQRVVTSWGCSLSSTENGGLVYPAPPPFAPPASLVLELGLSGLLPLVLTREAAKDQQ